MSNKKRPVRGKQLSLSTGIPHDLTEQLVERLNQLPESVKADYLRQEVLSKYVSKDTDPASVRKARAIFKWLCAEQDNEATNVRLQITHAEYNILPRVTYAGFVARCRAIIADIIGEAPLPGTVIGSFSGGASTSRCRTDSHPAFKYTGKVHCTQAASGIFLDEVVKGCPGWLNVSNSTFEIVEVEGNVLFTVPKKTDIDRVACKEPDLNMFMQKGVGDFFRDRLRRIGINLNDQSVNRSLAREGSITDDLATLDLSSASDSVTTGLVSLLLPEAWYNLLASLRSPVTIIDGEEHSNHMFSSMGNGFTFELESLLFYSIVRSVSYFRGARGVVSIYGDDIICPKAVAWYASSVLNFLGFQVNTDKSFYEGPFRESCGGHYHLGTDITPFYIREPIDTMIKLIDVANKLRQWDTITAQYEVRCQLDPILSLEVEEIWLWLKSFIPRCLWGGGDTSFSFQLASFDEPSMRIQSEKERKGTGLGGYYHWLNATWDRNRDTFKPRLSIRETIRREGPSNWLHDDVVTSRRQIELGRLRLRPVRDKTVPRLQALFSHEIEQALESYKTRKG